MICISKSTAEGRKACGFEPMILPERRRRRKIRPFLFKRPTRWLIESATAAVGERDGPTTFSVVIHCVGVFFPNRKPSSSSSIRHPIKN